MSKVFEGKQNSGRIVAIFFFNFDIFPILLYFFSLLFYFHFYFFIFFFFGLLLRDRWKSEKMKTVVLFLHLLNNDTICSTSINGRKSLKDEKKKPPSVNYFR